MFVIDPALSYLRASREQVMSIHHSINQPVVVVPGKRGQIAQAHVVSLRSPSGAYSVYIHLFLVESRESIFYTPERSQLNLQQFNEAETEALGFCESMGFLLDSAGFASLGARAQEELIRVLPPFQRDQARVVVDRGSNLQTHATPPAGMQLSPGNHAAGAPRASTLAPASAAIFAEPSTSTTPEQAAALARLLASF